MLASLALRSGGLGLRSALRTAPAAYWASWADTLPMMWQRCPQLAGTFCAALMDAEASLSTARALSLRSAAVARTELLAAGFADCPDWLDLLHGKRPPTPDLREPGEFAHGWQYFAASRLETSFREGAVLPAFGRPIAAHLRSQAGRCSGSRLTVLPVNKEFTWSSAKLRVLLLRRLRLPLHAAVAHCRCGRLLDALGDHRVACSTSGVLKLRAKPVEKAGARVCREAGARVQENVFLRELNLASLDTYDDRRLEVLATGLPLHHEAQLAVDITLIASLNRREGKLGLELGTRTAPHWWTHGGERRTATRSC